MADDKRMRVKLCLASLELLVERTRNLLDRTDLTDVQLGEAYGRMIQQAGDDLGA
jgi:hypothetical protein